MTIPEDSYAISYPLRDGGRFWLKEEDGLVKWGRSVSKALRFPTVKSANEFIDEEVHAARGAEVINLRNDEVCND